MNRCIEIRSYTLKPGSRDEFHALVLEKSIPLLKKWNVDVVAFGPSLHDTDSYYLIRSYSSLQDRESSQDAFYSSSEWRDGPREDIVSLIENDISVVIEVTDEALQTLRMTSSQEM